jgi:hypothetical protein
MSGRQVLKNEAVSVPIFLKEAKTGLLAAPGQKYKKCLKRPGHERYNYVVNLFG